MTKIEELANRPFRSEVKHYLALTAEDIRTMFAKEGYYVDVDADMGRVCIEPDNTLSDDEQDYVANIDLGVLIKKYFKVDVDEMYICTRDGDQCFPCNIVAFIND